MVRKPFFSPTCDYEMCFALQRHALFSTSGLPEAVRTLIVFCTFWLRNVLPANFSSPLWAAGSAPATLASLLFDPPEPQIIGKTQCFATCLPFRASASSVLTSVPLPSLLASNVLPTSGEIQAPSLCRKSQQGGVSCAMLQLYIKNGSFSIRSLMVAKPVFFSFFFWLPSSPRPSWPRSWTSLPDSFGVPQSWPGAFLAAPG